MTYGFYSTMVIALLAYLCGLAHQVNFRERVSINDRQYIPNIVLTYPIKFWIYTIMVFLFGIFELIGINLGYYHKNINKYYGFNGYRNSMYKYGELPMVIFGCPFIILAYPFFIWFVSYGNYTININKPDYLILFFAFIGYLMMFGMASDVVYANETIFCIDNKIKHNRKD